MDAASFRRPLIISTLLACALAACAWYYDTLATAMLCFLATAWQLARLLYYAVRRNRNGLQLCGMRFLIWAAALASAVAAHNYFAKLTRARGDALVTALQVYRAREGRYPQNLEALAPRDIAVIPAVALNSSGEKNFRYSSDGNKFSLNYYPGFLLTSEYDSTTAKWVTRD